MILFKPNGGLNLAIDASDLPESSDGKNSISEAMTRFKNLRIDLRGVTKTRDGSSKVNSTAFEGTTELVTNGTFTSSISSWSDNSTAGGSISWVAGVMRMTASTGIAIAQQSIAISAQNVEHTLEFDFTITGSSIVDVQVGTTSGGSELYGPISFSTTGTYTATFTPTAATVYLRFTHRTSAIDVDVDNVSIKRSVEPINLIVEQGGIRYEFAGTNIFRNESSI